MSDYGTEIVLLILFGEAGVAGAVWLGLIVHLLRRGREEEADP